ncbi:MAG: vWA domain-containing protein [Lachnospiraceae bacterium]
MGVTNSNKVADASAICCGDTFKMTLALTAAPDIVENPTDIVLVLDRSGSMSGAPLADMKVGAKTFIDIISESTGGAGSGEIGSGSRMGVVSFAANASVDAQLVTSVADLKAAVDGISAGGGTNHGDAFLKAQGLFEPSSSNARVIVMFTDGVTTSGPAPGPIAAAARAQGTVIYCIGLIGSDGLDVAALNNWATDPDASHVAVTPDAADLEELFAELAANISKPGATNVLIKEKLTSDFELVDIDLARDRHGHHNRSAQPALEHRLPGRHEKRERRAPFYRAARGLADGRSECERGDRVFRRRAERGQVPRPEGLCGLRRGRAPRAGA